MVLIENISLNRMHVKQLYFVVVDVDVDDQYQYHYYYYLNSIMMMLLLLMLLVQMTTILYYHNVHVHQLVSLNIPLILYYYYVVAAVAAVGCFDVVGVQDDDYNHHYLSGDYHFCLIPSSY